MAICKFMGWGANLQEGNYDGDNMRSEMSMGLLISSSIIGICGILISLFCTTDDRDAIMYFLFTIGLILSTEQNRQANCSYSEYRVC